MEAFKKLESEGFSVSYIDVDEQGRLKTDEFEKALSEDTILVSCMWVNNETGVIQPVEELKKIMKKYSPNAALHVDAVQAFGKIECKPKKYGIDMLSVSAHKIHGIKGTGALYSSGVRLDPLLVGGGQQKNMRSGTENVVGIAALGAACEALSCDAAFERTAILKKRLIDGISGRIERIRINGSGIVSPYLLNVSFLGIKAEILLHALETRGIFVSTGSACSSNKPMPSHVLSAMGRKREEIMGAVRFSLDAELSTEDIDDTVNVLEEEVAKIRKYMR